MVTVKTEPMEEDIDDDPVVKEITVYVSKKSHEIYMFQYPLKSAQYGYDNDIILKSFLKPDNLEVKLEIGLDTTNKNYDHSQGQLIAANAVSTSKNNEEKLFDGDEMDRIFLKSSRAMPTCDDYAIGVFSNDEFHITPLAGIIQLRPDFSYLDRVEKKMKNFQITNGEDSMDDNEDEPEEQEVHAKFARNVPDFVKERREKSFQTQAKKSMEEQWIPCHYQKGEEHHSGMMYCQAVENDTANNNLNITQSQYKNILAPKRNTKLKSQTLNPTNSLSYIQTLPLLEQLRLLMKDARIMTFEHLRAILSSEHDNITILKYLQQVALLVQDNWVVNSDIIYPKDTGSDNGIESKLMCRARDYILLCYTEREYIHRAEICSIVKLPFEEVSEIIDNLAIYEPEKGWRLLVNSTDFSKKYPDVANRQVLIWEAKGKQLRESMESQRSKSPQRRQR